MIVRGGPGAAGAGAPALRAARCATRPTRSRSAIASEDAGALSRVLARDVKRVFPGDSQRGRAAVLATYRGQFQGNEITGYELSDLDVGGGRAGRADGHATSCAAAAATPPAGGSCSASSASAARPRSP